MSEVGLKLRHDKYVRQPSSKKLSGSTSITPSTPTSPVLLEIDGAELTDSKLYTREWRVADSRATVYILHGFGEHCQRYDKFCEVLNELKISVATHDHIGHGNSDGHRIHVDTFDTYVHDALELIKEHKQTLDKDKPFILFGHSMGGLMATLCMLEEPKLFTAGILSSPLLMVHGKYNKTPLRVLARALSYVAPRFYIPSKSLALDPVDIIADEEARKDYDTDPLVWHYGNRAGSTSAMFDAISRAQANLLNLKVKCFVQHGTDDLVCDPTGVTPFKKIPEIVDLKLYPGAKHALLLDKQEIRSVAVKDCVDFIESVIRDCVPIM